MFVRQNSQFYISSLNYLFLIIFFLITPQYLIYVLISSLTFSLLIFHVHIIPLSMYMLLGGLGRILPSPVQTRVRARD